MHEIKQAKSGCLDDNSLYLGALETADKSEPPRRIDLEVNGTSTNFKIDCDADVSIISDRAYQNLSNRQKLKPANIKLQSADYPVSCVGQFIARVERKHSKVFVRKYVV